MTIEFRNPKGVRLAILFSVFIFFTLTGKPAGALDRRTFHMPANRVLAMDPEQFVKLYAAQVEHRTDGEYSNAAFCIAMDYYHSCLKSRTDSRSRTLQSRPRSIFLGLKRAVRNWLDTYYEWNLLFAIHGTFWSGPGWDDNVECEQLLSGIERGMHRHSIRMIGASASAFREVQYLNSEISWHKVNDVYNDEDKPKFVKIRSQARASDRILLKALSRLPRKYDGDIVDFIKHVRGDVAGCIENIPG